MTGRAIGYPVAMLDAAKAPPPAAWPVALEAELLDPPRPRARALIVGLAVLLLAASAAWIPTQGANYVVEDRETGASYWTDCGEYASDAIAWRWLWARTLDSRDHPGYRSRVVARVHWPILAAIQAAVLLFAGLALTWAVRRERRWQAGLVGSGPPAS